MGSLPLAPRLQRRLVSAQNWVVSALSGSSGAGRKSREAYSHVELHDNVRAYKVLDHQHTPEMAQTLSRAAGEPVEVTFTPHLLPVTRGILSTRYGD